MRINLFLFFNVEVVEYWNRLPREAMESPALEILKTQLYMRPNNLF